jgi:CRP/FNR family cyclic AMP-dependent transcriptional regulator
MISPEVLRRFSLFAGLDAEVFKDLAMTGEEVTVSAGEWLFKEGAAADALYLIMEGTVDLKINVNEAGTEQADLSSLVSGDVTGWSALVEPYTYTLGAVATSNVCAARLNGEQLRSLMEAQPEVGYQLMHRVAQAIATRLTNLRVRFVSLIGM